MAFEWPEGLRMALGLLTTREAPRPLDPDENRVVLFTAFLFLGLPAALGYGFYNLFWNARPRLAAVILVFAGSLLYTWMKVQKGRSGLALYRITAGIFFVLLLYMVLSGGPGGSMSLWTFAFPPTTLILFGYREGRWWNGGLLLGVAGLFWLAPAGLQVFAYPGPFKVRFIVIFVITWMITSWFDFLRQQYSLSLEAQHQRLQEERAALQEALSKVKQLSGMLPICSCCKKVRDDQGYWRQIEAFIRDRSEAEFSHGICPDCGEKLYPELKRKGQGE